MVYDPNQKTLNADRGEIRVGGKYQADVPTQRLYADGVEEGRKKNPIQKKSTLFSVFFLSTMKKILQHEKN